MASKQKYMSIRTELGIKFIAVVVFLIAMGFLSIIVFKGQLYQVKDIDSKNDLAFSAQELRANFDEMIVALKTMIIKADNPKIFNTQLKIFLKKYKNTKRYKKKVEKLLKIQQAYLSKETMKYYDEFLTGYNKFMKAYDKAIPYLKQGDAKTAIGILKGQGLNVVASLTKFVKTVRMIADNQRKEVMDKIQEMLKYLLYGLIFVAVIAIISTLTFMKRICNMVNQIKYLTKAADAISMGKPHEQLKSDRNNELGDLTNSFERMRVSLEKAMKKLNK